MPMWSKFLRNLLPKLPSSIIVGSSAVMGTYCIASLDDGDYENVATRDRIFGGYNNRIRQLSSREKIFHTFASHKGKDGQELMDWRDFRTAFLPYTFQNAEARSKEVVPDQFLKKFTTTMIRSHESEAAGSSDTNELMNFAEFAFIEAMAGIPKHRFHLALKMFDADGSGFIEEDELEKVLEIAKPTTMSIYTFKKVISGTAAYQDLIGGDGKVSIDEMYLFLCQLRESILKLEFDQYDHERKGSISSKDFAMCLVSHTHHKTVYTYLSHVKSCPDLGRITLEEFLEFNEAILQLDKIVEGLAFYFKSDFNITPKVLQHAFYAASGKNLPLNQMKILLHVVAKNRDGTVKLEDLSHLMSQRHFGRYERSQNAFFRKASCVWSCLKWQVASAEMIFKEYATHRSKLGESLMSWSEFRDSFLPHEIQVDEKRAETVHPHNFMWSITRKGKKIGSTDEDWLINLAEFSFIWSLISIPKHQFRLACDMFDQDRNGYIENNEIAQVFHCFKPDSMTMEEFSSNMLQSSMYHDLMGSEGRVTIEEMFKFLEDLRVAVLRIEFEYWDVEHVGSISSKDFARTLISYAHPQDIPRFSERVESCPDFGRITLEQYLLFNEAITQLDQIVEGLAFYFDARSETTAEVIRRAFTAATNVPMPFSTMEILMHVFDKNGDGLLEVDELFDVMNRRQGMKMTKRKDVNFSDEWRCMKECLD